MRGVRKLARRTLIGVFLLGAILLAFSALNPYSGTTTVVRILMIVVAVILAAGLLPNSYLHQFTTNSLNQRPERGSRLLVLISTLGPLFLIALAFFAIAANLDTVRLFKRLGVEFTDPRSAIYNIIQYAIFGIVSLILFVWNLLDLFRARSAAQAT